MEIHTTELTAECMRSVELRLSGKAVGFATSALYRGLLFHEAARLLHVDARWDSDVSSIVLDAAKIVAATLAEEGRVLSAACDRERPNTMAECVKLVGWYRERFAKRFAAAKLIGCEVPVRWTLNVDGDPVEFATHIDLLYREHDSLSLWDWKTGEDGTDYEHLARNMQLGMCAMAVAHGELCVGGEWMSFEELPSVAWINANALAPYGRGGKGKGDDGVERAYTKGQLRPMRAVVWGMNIIDEGAILDEFSVRVRMRRLGLWPTSPAPQRCMVCECRKACPTFDGRKSNEQERASERVGGGTGEGAGDHDDGAEGLD